MLTLKLCTGGFDHGIDMPECNSTRFILSASRDLQFEPLNTNAMDDLGCRKGVKEMPEKISPTSFVSIFLLLEGLADQPSL